MIDMDNAKTFLLKKIVGYKDNGFPNMGDLHARHIDEISEVMLMFVKETLSEIVDRLNKGEVVDIDGMILSFQKPKKSKVK
jgi:hypothetical protein